jgi:hypothetical protein
MTTIEKDTCDMLNMSVLDQQREWEELERIEKENEGFSRLKANKIRNWNQVNLPY